MNSLSPLLMNSSWGPGSLLLIFFLSLSLHSLPEVLLSAWGCLNAYGLSASLQQTLLSYIKKKKKQAILVVSLLYQPSCQAWMGEWLPPPPPPRPNTHTLIKYFVKRSFVNDHVYYGIRAKFHTQLCLEKA